MIRHIVSSNLLAVAFGLAGPVLAAPALAQPDGASLFAEHCAACHGDTRLGGTGPALIPEALGRIKGEDLSAIIAGGRVATQMPAFAETLTPEDIAALAAYIAEPLAEPPVWTADDIAATREFDAGYVPADAPVFTADPLNITLVVETGDHHVSVLDGDTFDVLDRFPTPFAVHGGPKFSPDGRFVFIMSRDGWVQKYDIWSLHQVGRVRAGLNSRNIAMSHDGKWLAVANYLPRTLTILSTTDLSVARVIDVTGRDGTPSRVSAVYQAPDRKSFVLALKDVPEISIVLTEVHSGNNSTGAYGIGEPATIPTAAANTVGPKSPKVSCGSGRFARAMRVGMKTRFTSTNQSAPHAIQPAPYRRCRRSRWLTPRHSASRPSPTT